MKPILTLIFAIILSVSHAQQNYQFENPDIDIPEWLLNKNYIEQNKTDEKSISIDSKEITIINGILVVEFELSESAYTSGYNSLYIATFNSGLNILDIVEIASYSSSDWDTQGVFLNRTIEPDILEYYYTNIEYIPAENEEEAKANGGISISKSDTTITYCKIEKDGKISTADDLAVFTGYPEEGDNGFDEEACVLKIRQLFNDINKNQSSYRKVVKKSGENISLNYFYQGKTLKKLIESNSSNGQALDYYFNDGLLIFIYAYNKIKKTESRYYFNDNKMLRWLKGAEKEPIAANSSEFETKTAELLARTTTLIIEN